MTDEQGVAVAGDDETDETGDEQRESTKQGSSENSTGDQSPEPEIEIEELPGWVRKVTETAQKLPGGSRRLATWLPTLTAGWRAAERGLTLAAGLRDQVDGDESLEWPEELADDFSQTLAEFGETVPGVDEVIPAAAEIIELLEARIASDVPTGTIGRATERLEHLVESILRRLLEVAFFESDTRQEATKNRHLRRLFNRLEDLFDRLVYLWLQESERTRDQS